MLYYLRNVSNVWKIYLILFSNNHHLSECLGVPPRQPHELKNKKQEAKSWQNDILSFILSRKFVTEWGATCFEESLEGGHKPLI